MKDESPGREQVTLSLESSRPFGHLHTAVASDDADAADLPVTAGARRQRWEQRRLSQGLDTAGCEMACIS